MAHLLNCLLNILIGLFLCYLPMGDPGCWYSRVAQGWSLLYSLMCGGPLLGGLNPKPQRPGLEMSQAHLSSCWPLQGPLSHSERIPVWPDISIAVATCLALDSSLG